MARIRTIKPEFWTSEQIVECSPTARLLFVGLWNFADDRGVIPRRLRSIKMLIFPGDEFTTEKVNAWLIELEQHSLVRRFESEGTEYLAITGWEKHQRIDRPSFKHPVPPEFDDGSPTVRRTLDESSPTAHQTPGAGRERRGGDRNGEDDLPHTRAKSSTSSKEAADHRTSGKPAELPPPDGPPAAFNHEAELRFVQEWNTLAAEFPAHLVRHGSGSLTKFTRDRLADRWASSWSTDWPVFVEHLRSERCDKTAMSVKQVVEGDLLDRVVAEAKHPQPKRKRSARRSSRRSNGSETTSEGRWRDFELVDLDRELTKYRKQIATLESNKAASVGDLQKLTELQATAGEIEAEIGRRKDKASQRLERTPLFDCDIVNDDLTDVRRRERLFNQLVDSGHLQHNTADRLRLHTLAIHVAESDSAKSPPALFLSLLKAALAGGSWPGSNEQEDRAHEQLRKLTAKKPPNGQLVTLGDKLKAAVPAGVGADD